MKTSKIHSLSKLTTDLISLLNMAFNAETKEKITLLLRAHGHKKLILSQFL